ncbi:MAG: energy transducer TonB [Emcibacteraceae bacterium]|nr:energy transducer TonB [Emcibacteraceae bacterium]
MILYKQLLINVSQLYLSGDNPDKALEFLDLYFTYEHSPSWSVYMIAVRGFLIKKDYETAIKYVDLSEQAHIRLTQNYNERQLTRFKDRIENTNKQITATREMLQRGLAGEDISWTEEKSASENEKKENADHDFQILHFSNPVFPKKAIEEKIEGWVQLKFDIDNSSKAINIEVANSSNKIFEEPALAALFEYRFNVLRNQNEDGFLIGTTLRIEFAFAEN